MQKEKHLPGCAAEPNHELSVPEPTQQRLQQYSDVTGRDPLVVQSTFMRGTLAELCDEVRERVQGARLTEAEKVSIVHDARIAAGWKHLADLYPKDHATWLSHFAKESETKRRAKEARSKGPWVGRAGWEEEKGIPIKTEKRNVRRHGKSEEEEVPVEEGYEIYNSLVSERHYRPFRTTAGEVRIAIPGPGGLEIVDPCNNEGGPASSFIDRLGYSLYMVGGDKVPFRELAIASTALIRRALSRELPSQRVVRLWLRVAPDGHLRTRLDLCDSSRRCVLITPAEWKVETVGHPVFDAKSGMLPLPEPIPSVDPKDGWKRIERLWEHIPIAEPKGAVDSRLLLLAELVQFLVAPSSARTVAAIVGPEGIGKSSTAERIQGLVDPSESGPVKPPKDDEAFENLAVNHAVVNLDNVSNISLELSDNLARLTTGIGLPRRKLYTNSEEMILRAHAWVVLNGITATPRAADLLRRAVFLDVERPAEIIPLEELRPRWEQALPELLGGLLDLAVLTLRVLRDHTPPLQSSSMADFVRIGQAVASAMGRERSEFIVAWQANLERQGAAAAEDAWVSALAEYFSLRGPEAEAVRSKDIALWIGENCRTLFERPVTATSVGMAIQRSQETLKKLGIYVGSRLVDGTTRYFRALRPSDIDGSGKRRTLDEQYEKGPEPGPLGPLPADSEPVSREETDKWTSSKSCSGPSPKVHLGEVDLASGSTTGPLQGPLPSPADGREAPGSAQSGPSGPVSVQSGKSGESSTPAGVRLPKVSDGALEESELGETRTDRLRRRLPLEPRAEETTGSEWASPRCKHCPACSPPHESPSECTCSRCDPWGVPAGSSGSRVRPHYCGMLGAGQEGVR